MKSNLLIGLLLAALAGIAPLKAQKNASFPVADLKLRWELLTNNYENESQCLAVLRLSNKGNASLPAAGWALYFNYNRGIFPERSSGPFTMQHLNGDLFVLRPAAGFAGLAPGASAELRFVSEGAVLNYTAAPINFYLVWDAAPGKGYPIADFAHEAIRDTTVGYTTPAQRYEKNRAVTDIPGRGLLQIFPTPVQYRDLQGYFQLDGATLVADRGGFSGEAKFLAHELGQYWGADLKAAAPTAQGKAIYLLRENMPEEAYRLRITPEKIEISAGSGAGIFYGIQSLRTLLPPDMAPGAGKSVQIPAVDVKDQPRFGYRSLMLDVARNFQTKEELLKVLDLMALYKLNVLHLHCIDDEGWRVEIPALPELTQVGARRGHTLDSKSFLSPSYGANPDPGQFPSSGFYTRADFIEILRYATDRHIRIIPEIESPGHSRAAIKAMDARYDYFMAKGDKAEAERYLLRDLEDRSVYTSAQLWHDNVMCVALPSTYRFLETVVDAFINMYKEAGAPLETIHLGGDEVPAGVWEGSPACRALIDQDPKIASVDDLWYYYYDKVATMLQSRGLFLSGWEEIAMRKTRLDGQKHFIPNPDFALRGFQAHVWNNGIGWGAEDLPYRLANAGYKVVLSCVSNQYFDLAYEKSPDEPGYYWGGFIDLDKPFYFIPFDYYKNTKEDTGGNPISPTLFVGKDRLTEYGQSNIVGIQGLLWAETLRGGPSMEYMLLPKILGLAERAWAPDPEWARAKDPAAAEKMYEQAWSRFVSTLGHRELPRMEYLHGGYNYRIPPVGAVVIDGAVHANCQIPGFIIRYTTDGSEPTAQSAEYDAPIVEKGTITLCAFSVTGRKGRSVLVQNP